MTVKRINILNAPDGSIDTIDKYQFAVGTYIGSGGGTVTIPFIFKKQFGKLLKLKNPNSKKAKLSYLSMRFFRDLG